MDIKVFLVPTKNFVKTNPIVICFKNSRAWSDSIWNFVYGCKNFNFLWIPKEKPQDTENSMPLFDLKYIMMIIQ